MLALRIEYLTGRAVATEYRERSAAEWPPHPARVFSALVATAADVDAADPAEREALEWLERAPPPSVRASDCARRTAVTHYVPLNHATLPRGVVANLSTKALPNAVTEGLRLIPDRRMKLPRTFPSVTPDDPVVWLVWPNEPPDELRRALAHLVARVVRIGHSSSLVACRVCDDAPEAGGWVPDPDGALVMRVPGEGQLAALDDAFAQHRETEPRILPARFHRYRRSDTALPSDLGPSVFAADDWVVLRRIGGPRLPLTRAVDVARAVRRSLLVERGVPIPHAITGHAPDGTATDRPHLAIVPLPDVGHAHATGSLLGVALILPRDLPDDERRAVLGVLGRWEQERRVELDDDEVDAPPLPLRLGRAGVWVVERVAWGTAPQSGLRERTWLGPARTWTTATPIALDRNPGDLLNRDPAVAERAYAEAEASVALASTRIGLPVPAAVSITARGGLVGSEHVRRFPPYPFQEGRTRRVKVHATLRFDRPVQGPVVLGAGRYLGLGLCRPVDPC